MRTKIVISILSILTLSACAIGSPLYEDVSYRAIDPQIKTCFQNMSISEYESASKTQIKRCIVDAVGGNNNPKFHTTADFTNALQSEGFECDHKLQYCNLIYRTRTYGIYLFSPDKNNRQDELIEIHIRLDGASIKEMTVLEEDTIDASGSITGSHRTDESVPQGKSSDDVLGPLTKQHAPPSQHL